MRIVALSLSVIGVFLLLLVADCRWGFVPLHLVGLESGLIVASLAFFAGIAVSLLAALFAFLHLRRTAGVASSRWLLVWCCVLLLGFPAVFLHK